MSQKGSYKKITVSSHADSSSNQTPDEEVIYVGASSAVSDEAKTPSPTSDTKATQEASEITSASDAEDAGKQQSNDDTYHEQTLDDLNNIDVPFQKTQRIVLIVMGLLVIAFCVYWFGLR